MPKLLNQKGIAHIFILLVLFIGIVVGLVLLKNPKIFSPKAAPVLPDNPEVSFELELEKNADSPFPDDTTPSSIAPDSQFRVDVYARSDIEEANLFSAKIQYSADTVDFVSIEKREGQSFVKNWVDASSDAGMVNLVGGYPNPGIKTDSKVGALLMGSIIFKSKGSGAIKIEVSDTSAIYSNTTNINILTVKKGTIEVPITSVQPTPTPTPAPVVSCTNITVTGAIEGKLSNGDIIYIVESEEKANLKAFVTPEDSKVTWSGYNSSNLPNGGTWNPSDNAVTVWTAPKNTGSQLEGVQVRVDIAGKTPVVSCKPVNMAVKPAVQPTPAPSPIIGFGKAIKLDGASNVVVSVSPQLQSLVCSVQTIEMWIKPDSKNLGKATNIISKGTPFRGFDLMTNGGGTLAFYVNGKQFFSSTALKPDQWHHVAVVIDRSSGKKVSLYLDGKLDGSMNTPNDDGYCVKSGDIRIGSSNRGLIAEIDEMRLSQSILYTSNFTPSSSPFTGAEIALYHFDDTFQNSGTTGLNGQNEVSNPIQFVESTVAGVIPSPKPSALPSPTTSPTPVTYLLGEFLETFGLTLSDAKFNSKYDYNSDGRISVVDYSGLLSKFDPKSFQLKTGYSVDELIPTYNKTSTDSGFNAKYDVNSDKAVNKDDYTILNQDTVTGNGDGNNDDKVDFADLSILLTDYNKNQSFRTGIDINGDGKVNSFDFGLMKNLLIKNGLVKST